MSADLKPGDRIKVVAGLAKGQTGRVRRLSHIRWAASIPMVDLILDGDPLERCIRADYLAPAEGAS